MPPLAVKRDGYRRLTGRRFQSGAADVGDSINVSTNRNRTAGDRVQANQQGRGRRRLQDRTAGGAFDDQVFGQHVRDVAVIESGCRPTVSSTSPVRVCKRMNRPLMLLSINRVAVNLRADTSVIGCERIDAA